MVGPAGFGGFSTSHPAKHGTFCPSGERKREEQFSSKTIRRQVEADL
jgi:hypothetical protein